MFLITLHDLKKTRVGFQLLHAQIDRARGKSRPDPAGEPPPPSPPLSPDRGNVSEPESGPAADHRGGIPYHARAAPFESACAR